MLMTMEGRWIDATHGGSDNFNFSLLVNDAILLPGTYMI